MNYLLGSNALFINNLLEIVKPQRAREVAEEEKKGFFRKLLNNKLNMI